MDGRPPHPQRVLEAPKLSLVIHTHVTEPEVTAAIRNHHLNLALILQTIRNDEDAIDSVRAQIRALGLRDPASVRSMERLLAVMENTARDAASDGFAQQRDAIATVHSDGWPRPAGRP